MSDILITGGTGKTGRRIASRLGTRARIAARSTGFDWDDESTWAFDGVRAAYLAYAPDLAVPGSPEIVGRFAIRAALAGVERLVLLAGRGEPRVEPAITAVRASGVPTTVLACAFFCQNFSEGLLAPQDGVIAFPAGEVAEPFIDCDDIADVAVAALTDPRHDGETYELTGPTPITFAEAAAALAEAWGRPVRYAAVTPEAYAELLAPHLPPLEIAFLVKLFRTLLDGHNAYAADGVARALGRAPRAFAAYAAA
ncbi:MAG TPA: NmrA family NAD(P)-binding protein [Kofleriaceae bacterium]|nr:NmrA family NAD(P)-binding protein [Kofleriaceae bacterium]